MGFSSFALALTADEYYSRAAKKYVMEDLEGAEADLKRVLELDPGHEKARELLDVVQKELMKTRPAVPAPVVTPTTVPPSPVPMLPPTIVQPRPTPTPTVPSKIQKASVILSSGEKLFKEGRYSEAETCFRQVLELLPGHEKATGYIREIREKAEKERSFIPQVTGPPAGGIGRIVNELLLLGIGLAVVVLYVIVRLGYAIFHKKIAERRMQVCPDCKLKNSEDAEFCQHCGTRLRAWSVISGSKKKWFSKFGWKHNPFTLDVIPSLFTGYASQVEAILDKISTRSGHILVYGEKGVGKTTLLRWLAENLKKDNHAIYIARPPINFDDLLRYIVMDLKGKGHKQKYSLYELEELVKKSKKPVVVLIDEAHEVLPEIEQQMRSLGDIEKVNLVLAGLPETREKIKRESPPLFDRIVLESYIDHLNVEETRDLIKKRIEAAGGKDVKPFTNEAVENVYKMSKGRPRMILKVCDWVIADAIKNNLDVIGAEIGKDFPKHDLEEGKPAEKT